MLYSRYLLKYNVVIITQWQSGMPSICDGLPCSGVVSHIMEILTASGGPIIRRHHW